LDRKIVFVGIVGAFAIVFGIVAFSGSSIIDDTSGGSIVSTSGVPRETLPINFELDGITILEVNNKAATIQVAFKVTNPNFKSVILQVVTYELFENDVQIKLSQIGERPIGMLESSNYFPILSNRDTILKDTFTIKNSGNSDEFWDALINNTPQWKIKGVAYFNLSSITAGGENEISFEFP